MVVSWWTLPYSLDVGAKQDQSLPNARGSSINIFRSSFLHLAVLPIPLSAAERLQSQPYAEYPPSPPIHLIWCPMCDLGVSCALHRSRAVVREGKEEGGPWHLICSDAP